MNGRLVLVCAAVTLFGAAASCSSGGNGRAAPRATIPSVESSAPPSGSAELAPQLETDPTGSLVGGVLERPCSLMTTASIVSMIGEQAIVARQVTGDCRWASVDGRTAVHLTIEIVEDTRSALEAYQAKTDVEEAVSGLGLAALVSHPNTPSAAIAVFGPDWRLVLRAPGRGTAALTDAVRTAVARLPRR